MSWANADVPMASRATAHMVSVFLNNMVFLSVGTWLFVLKERQRSAAFSPSGRDFDTGDRDCTGRTACPLEFYRLTGSATCPDGPDHAGESDLAPTCDRSVGSIGGDG